MHKSNLSSKTSRQNAQLATVPASLLAILLLGCGPSGPPQLDDVTYSILETAQPGEIVGQVPILKGRVSELDFRVLEHGDSFSIKPGTSVVTVRKTLLLDADTYPSLSLKIEAENPEGEKGWATLTLELVNVDEPPIVPKGLRYMILNTARDGDPVGPAHADDPEDKPITYKLVGLNPPDLFRIDQETGLLEVGNALAFPSEPTTVKFQVEVSDGTTPPVFIDVEVEVKAL